MGIFSFLKGGSDDKDKKKKSSKSSPESNAAYKIEGPKPEIAEEKTEKSIFDTFKETISGGSDEERKEAVLSVAADIPHQDAIYEQLAHGIYGNIPPEVIHAYGYELAGNVEDAATSFTGRSYVPRKDLTPEERAAIEESHGKPLVPVTVFKGTQELAPDVITDLNAEGVGAWQFKRNIGNIQSLLQMGGGKSDVTGHSLGGALAQWAASDMAGLVGRVVTFQAPGISAEAAAKVDAYNRANPDEAVQVTHYEAAGDPMSGGGEKKLTGDIFEADIKGINGVWNHSERILSNVIYLQDGPDKDNFRNDGGAALEDRMMSLKKGHTDDKDQGKFESARRLGGSLMGSVGEQDKKVEQWNNIALLAESGTYSLKRIEAIIDSFDISGPDKAQHKANLRVRYPDLA